MTIDNGRTDYQVEFLQEGYKLLQFLEAHPSLIPEYSAINLYSLVDSVEDVTKAATSGGTWEKKFDSSNFEVTRKFGPHFVKVFIGRELFCEKVKVGEHLEEVVDPEAPKIQVTVEDYKWICPESILAKVEKNGND